MVTQFHDIAKSIFSVTITSEYIQEAHVGTMHRRLPVREKVFIQSLKRHGYKKAPWSGKIKKHYGYFRISTLKEDSLGIDIWIKMPRMEKWFQVQVTQRGERHHVVYKNGRPRAYCDERIERKRRQCRENGVLFLIIRDVVHRSSTPKIAHSDVTLLRKAVAHIPHKLKPRYEQKNPELY